MKNYRRVAAVFFEVSLVLLLSMLWVTTASADKSPAGCTGSGLGIGLYTDKQEVRIGEVISYSVEIYNGSSSGPVVCDASGIQAAIITPDSAIHPITLLRTTLSNGDIDDYSNVVTYTARDEDVNSENILTSGASVIGDIHQNDTNGQGGANQAVNVRIITTPIPATLYVIKTVVNDNGGVKVVSDFPLFINSALIVSGTANVLAPGSYVVTETTNSNYAQTFSANCPDGNITLVSGDEKTCTITNDDIAVVVLPPPSSGGNSYVPTVPPLIDVVKVPSPLALPAGPGLVTYTYTLHNIGTVPVINITMVDDTCNPLVFISGDANADTKLDVNETWIYNCSATLLATHTNTVVATGWANGISTTDIAKATVIVGPLVLGASIVPPLIHVTKVPSPVAVLAEEGTVVYTERITNPGTVALSNVLISDDKCSPVDYISGDTNSDLKLDVNETWTYACQMNLTETTTNTVTVSGQANGLTARDFAIATVIVGEPGLPNTGFPPERKNNLWNIAIFAGAFMFVLMSSVVLRKNIVHNRR